MKKPHNFLIYNDTASACVERDGTQYFIIIDKADFERVGHYPWQIVISKSGNTYARCWRNKKTLLLHRLVMNAPEGKQVDHINRNGLDNRRANLRLVNQTQNNHNCRPHKRSVNPELPPGVVPLDKARGKYGASIIKTLGKRTWLGTYYSIAEAAEAYLKAKINLTKELYVAQD